MTKRKKRIVFFVIAIPFIIIALHFHFHSAFKKIIHADKSVNPIATDYFAHAMLINMGTKIIHDFVFVDYDSFLLKPLSLLEDRFFSIGQQHIDPGNIAEEGAWWALLHMDKFGIIKSFGIKRRDKSMHLSRLPNEESLAIRNKAYNYFLAIVDSGVRGIDLKEKEFSAVYALFTIPFNRISHNYPGQTEKERIDNYWEDPENYRKAFLSNQKFKKYIRNNPYYKKRSVAVNSTLRGRLGYLLGFNYFNKHPDVLCGKLLDDYLNLLASPELDSAKINKKVIAANLKDFAQECPTQKDKINSIQEKFQ